MTSRLSAYRQVSGSRQGIANPSIVRLVDASPVRSVTSRVLPALDRRLEQAEREPQLRSA